MRAKKAGNRTGLQFAVADRSEQPVSLINSACSPAVISEVLKDAFGEKASQNLITEQVGAGRQAIVFVARRRDHKAITGAHCQLAVKMYRPSERPSLRIVRAEYEALSTLHRELHGLRVQGWRIFVPTSFYVSAVPLGMVMTVAPGRPLSSWMESDDEVPAILLEAVPAAIVSALLSIWCKGQQHGDLQLHNILCDVDGKTIAFVDPDKKLAARPSPDPAYWQIPASSDLSYILYDASVTIKGLAARRAPWRHRQFAECILDAAMQKIGDPDEKRAFLEAVDRAAQQRVKTHVNLTWSRTWPWRVFLRWLAFRRITRVVRSLHLRHEGIEVDVASRGSIGNFVSKSV
jgi:hypothetical protein